MTRYNIDTLNTAVSRYNLINTLKDFCMPFKDCRKSEKKSNNKKFKKREKKRIQGLFKKYRECIDYLLKKK